MKTTYFLLFSLFVSISATAAKKDLTILLRDRLGAPISNVEVSINGLGKETTNADGEAIFEKAAKSGKKFKVSIEETETYLAYEDKSVLPKSNTFHITLGWQNAVWKELMAAAWETQVKAMDSINSTKDFSEFDACSDLEGNHDVQDAQFPLDPKFLGGYVMDNVKYPENSIDMDEQGKVYLSFVVGSDGTISQVKIERGVSRDLDREAKRVIRSMPKWIPGTCNGERIATRCFLPIVFTLT